MKISVQELLIVLLIVLIVFGPTQLPKLTKSIGESLRSFKKGMEEESPKNEDAPKKEDAPKTEEQTAADEEKD